MDTLENLNIRDIIPLLHQFGINPSQLGPEKIERLALAASEFFDVQIEKNCTLLTIRHYNDQIIQQLTEGRTQLLSQKTKETIQILLKTQ